MNHSDVEIYSENILKWLDSLQLIGKTGLRAIRSEEIVKKEIILSIENAKKLVVDRYILGQKRIIESEDFLYKFVALSNIVDRISKKFKVSIPENLKMQQLLSKL